MGPAEPHGALRRLSGGVRPALSEGKISLQELIILAKLTRLHESPSPPAKSKLISRLLYQSLTMSSAGQDFSLRDRAKALDSEDALPSLHHEFVIPTKADIASKRLAREGECRTRRFVYLIASRHLPILCV